MTKKSTKDVVESWFKKGSHDLEAAQSLLHSNPLLTDVICYHCHQAVEKHLKGFLVFKQISFSKTHDLDYLLELCVKAELAFSGIQKEVQSLSSYDSDIRYPEGDEDYSLEETIAACATTENILKLIRKLLSIPT